MTRSFSTDARDLRLTVLLEILVVQLGRSVAEGASRNQTVCDILYHMLVLCVR